MSRQSELLKGSFVTLLLALLSRHGEMYGYEIAQRLSEATDGNISPGQSTLYPALHQLEAAGHVRSRWREVEGRQRKYYAITAAGRSELTRRQEEWQRFQAMLNSVLQSG